MAKKTATKRVVETTVKPYELMLIISPDLREPEVKKKLKEIEGMIEKAGGKVTNEDYWGKKNLSYRINKHYEGIYVVYNLELPNTYLGELKTFFRIEKDVLRAMIISLPSDYVYTKYDLEAKSDEKPRGENPKKTVSVKEKVSIAPAKEKTKEKAEEPKEEKIEKSAEDEPAEEKIEDKKEKKADDKLTPEEAENKERESELDKKLDEILGGEDLKL